MFALEIFPYNAAPVAGDHNNWSKSETSLALSAVICTIYLPIGQNPEAEPKETLQILQLHWIYKRLSGGVGSTVVSSVGKYTYTCEWMHCHFLVGPEQIAGFHSFTCSKAQSIRPSIQSSLSRLPSFTLIVDSTDGIAGYIRMVVRRLVVISIKV